tara:strand:- start:64 stop:231 length:168 start_codon:yes stop_codon:yes gene_type:complete
MKWAANTAEIYKKQKEPAKNQTLAQKKTKAALGAKRSNSHRRQSRPIPPRQQKLK